MNLIKLEHRMVVTGEGGRANGEILLIEYEVSVMQDEEVLNICDTSRV